ncbi:MAG: glycosyltransferase [Lachnospiraceae bacterium]|nr:glycosyltransferase [Lachnospiraceae bacterium]
MKLVSVVVLSYRSAETIVETLESIKNQTYPNIELIITDDASPDNTVQVVQQWIAKNEGALTAIKLVTSDKNTGLPANINRGLKAATGKYYKGIAGDDYMTADAIACYVRFCEEHPNVFPIAKVHLFNDQNPDAVYPDVQAYCERCYEFARKDYQEQYRMLLVQNRIVAPSATFYTMDFIRKIGGYEECYRWFEDYPMNLEAMHAGYKFGLLDKEIVWYRMSDKSVTASSLSRLKKTEMKLFFRKRFWYLFQNGMGWEAVKQCKSWLKVLVQK